MDTDLTVGVEEEFLLVTADGALSAMGPAIADNTAEPDGELQRELARCQVEAASSVCRTAQEVLTALSDMRGRLARAAARRGGRLVATATPILPQNSPLELTPEHRYRRMAEHFGEITQTGSTCGCHVHVRLPDRETGVRIASHLRPWLPLFLALTANSPYTEGRDTGYASWRQVLWSRWPSSGPPPVFGSLDEYEASVAAMLRSGAMLDRGMLYWDVRLSDQHPTIEMRVCDVTAEPVVAAMAAALVRALVARALDDIESGRPPIAVPTEVLRASFWRAARDGLSGSCLTPDGQSLRPAVAQLRDLVTDLAPTLKALGDEDFIDSTLHDVLESGGGAKKQRDAYARRHDLADVVDEMVVAG
ncbi:carboxylate-amine ligase [Fodinicola acaciae]|uniref:carboxylate-amine ligase n=1 Tax=Fodinicola acaciae TaxID=2681555 RepID=UPI0013D26BFF|nr:glutamate--cysteine ligase [Fodinicola acaciae]